MLQTKWILPLMICWALTCPAISWGEGNIELLSRVETEVVKTNEKGEKEIVRQPAAKVVPGDAVIYTNTYRNVGKEPADDVVINNPVPQHTQYIAGSAFGKNAEILFSADGGKSFDKPEKLTIPAPDGQKRPARADEYTDIRWIIKSSVKPNESGEVGFRVKLQ